MLAGKDPCTTHPTSTKTAPLCYCLMQAGQHTGSGSGTNLFDSKTDKGSADLYFHYYGMLQHQQNMLQVNRGILGRVQK